MIEARSLFLSIARRYPALAASLVVVCFALISAQPARAQATLLTGWLQQSPGTSPSARWGASMVYDAATGQVVLFGGQDSNGNDLNDTWTWNGTTWTQQFPATSPTAREYASMVYDAGTGQVVLFGGFNAGDLNDTWTWDGTTWTQQSPANSPSARDSASMAYDAGTGRVVIFGGENQYGLLNDTWTWDGTTWTQQSPATSPSARAASPMVYDAATGQVVLFGGTDVSSTYNGTWMWDGTTWTQQSLTTSPTARAYAMMAYDAGTDQVVLFGGHNYSTSNTFNDTWNWNGATWAQQSSVTSPSARYSATMAYDVTTGKVVLFGGGSSVAGPYLGDTWTMLPSVLNLGTANVCPTGTTPSPCSQSATLHFQIAANTTIGSIKFLTAGQASQDFQATSPDSSSTLCTTTTYSAQTSCTVDVTFSPKYPGLRKGAVVLEDGSGVPLATAYVYGIGKGPLEAFAPGTISTVAGNGTAGFSGDGSTATSAELSAPKGVAVDGAGNIYIADTANNRIREVNLATGNITTVAGDSTQGYSGDGGAATSAELNAPSGVAVDGAGNFYIADTANNRIREVNAATGIITTVAGDGTAGYSGDSGAATSAELNAPSGVAVDGAGNLYIVDGGNDRIREVNVATGIITTEAGNGTAGFSGDGGAATSAELNAPSGITVDDAGNIYIADTANNRIREVNAATGIITTVAGNGTAGFSGDGGAATSAELNAPSGVTVDGAGNIYIADSTNNRVREVNAASGIITTVAGNGTAGFSGDSGAATSAELNAPSGALVDSTGNLLIADTSNNSIREIDVAASPSLSFASTSVGATSSDSPQTVTVQNIGNGTLTFPIPSSGYNPSVPTNFTYDNSSTCLQNGSGASTPFTLAAGVSCTVAIDFSPTTTGTISGDAVLTDDSLNAAVTQSIGLSGTATATVPDPPTNVTATAGDAQATVSFTPPASTGGAAITGYTATSSPGSITGTCTASPCTVTGLTNGTSYTFTVTATNSVGTSQPSSPSNAVTPGISQTITFANPGPQTYGTQVTLTATASSGLAVTFTSATPAICTVTSTGVLSPIGVGTCTINANQAGNATYASAPQVTQSFTVNPAPLKITANNATKVYGTANPTFTGSVTGAVNGDTFTESFSTTATTLSSVGTYPITPSVTGTNLADYNVTPVDGTLTVTQASSTTTLTTNTTNVHKSSAIILTATVTSQTSGTPTGTVEFLEGSTVIGTGTLSSGVATYTPASLPHGKNSYTAQYLGDGNFIGSTSAPVTIVGGAHH